MHVVHLKPLLWKVFCYLTCTDGCSGVISLSLVFQKPAQICLFCCKSSSCSEWWTAAADTYSLYLVYCNKITLRVQSEQQTRSAAAVINWKLTLTSPRNITICSGCLKFVHLISTLLSDLSIHGSEQSDGLPFHSYHLLYWRNWSFWRTEDLSILCVKC